MSKRVLVLIQKLPDVVVTDNGIDLLSFTSTMSLSGEFVLLNIESMGTHTRKIAGTSAFQHFYRTQNAYQRPNTNGDNHHGQDGSEQLCPDAFKGYTDILPKECKHILVCV